ncbi:hypothetical protein GEOBRER4_n1615 [Citrifermentans bremense]|uniref:Uncharacterized protein n=1 Tax=Citrifermentans bremense TaxID=60035 RepID=A0A7R7IYL7_9BACT|nr:hypothetical protein GEOBRER4_n1615 [Citrifermentans bremense]
MKICTSGTNGAEVSSGLSRQYKYEWKLIKVEKR